MNISVNHRPGPVVPQSGHGFGVEFNRYGRLESRSLKPKIEASRSRVETNELAHLGPLLLERLDYLLSHSCGIGPDLGLPKAENGPPHFPQAQSVLLVPLSVPLNLGEPVGGVRTLAELLAPAFPISAMPKVTVAEDRELRACENDVRPSGEVRQVFSVPAAGSPQGASEHDLTASIGLLAAAARGSRGARRGGAKSLEARPCLGRRRGFGP